MYALNSSQPGLALAHKEQLAVVAMGPRSRLLNELEERRTGRQILGDMPAARCDIFEVNDIPWTDHSRIPVRRLQHHLSRQHSNPLHDWSRMSLAYSDVIGAPVWIETAEDDFFRLPPSADEDWRSRWREVDLLERRGHRLEVALIVGRAVEPRPGHDRWIGRA